MVQRTGQVCLGHLRATLQTGTNSSATWPLSAVCEWSWFLPHRALFLLHHHLFWAFRTFRHQKVSEHVSNVRILRIPYELWRHFTLFFRYYFRLNFNNKNKITTISNKVCVIVFVKATFFWDFLLFANATAFPFGYALSLSPIVRPTYACLSVRSSQRLWVQFVAILQSKPDDLFCWKCGALACRSVYAERQELPDIRQLQNYVGSHVATLRTAVLLCLYNCNQINSEVN